MKPLARIFAGAAIRDSANGKIRYCACHVRTHMTPSSFSLVDKIKAVQRGMLIIIFN